MISNWSNYFTLIVLITAVLALTAVLIMFIKEKLYKHKEIFLLINILIADLFFSVAYLSMLALLQNPQALLIPGIILDMAINASVFFAVIVSYCAYRCLYDPNYLNQKNNFIFLVIVGYITPIFYTIMLFVLPQFDQNKVLIVTVNLSYPLICVGVSFFFYVKIYLLFNVFELNKDQKSRIKILFLFPFIIFMLVLLVKKSIKFSQSYFSVSKRILAKINLLVMQASFLKKPNHFQESLMQ